VRGLLIVILEPSRLLFQDEKHSILAKIKRVWYPANLAKSDVRYVAVQFLRKEKSLNKELEREILQVQRGAMYKA
jgi:hypothetical protein